MTLFLQEAVWTYEETQSIPLRIPYKSYVEELSREWWDSWKSGQPCVIEKSRRMVASWILRACDLWDAGRRPVGTIVAHQTDEDAEEHVWRYWYMYEQMRSRFTEWELPEPKKWGGMAALRRVEGLALSNGSFFQRTHQHPEKLRGQGIGRIVLEEVSSYRRPDAVFAQAKTIVLGPASERGGHLYGVCNASGNPLYLELIEAAIDGSRSFDVARTPDGV